MNDARIKVLYEKYHQLNKIYEEDDSDEVDHDFMDELDAVFDQITLLTGTPPNRIPLVPYPEPFVARANSCHSNSYSGLNIYAENESTEQFLSFKLKFGTEHTIEDKPELCSYLDERLIYFNCQASLVLSVDEAEKYQLEDLCDVPNVPCDDEDEFEAYDLHGHSLFLFLRIHRERQLDYCRVNNVDVRLKISEPVVPGNRYCTGQIVYGSQNQFLTQVIHSSYWRAICLCGSGVNFQREWISGSVSGVEIKKRVNIQQGVRYILSCDPSLFHRVHECLHARSVEGYVKKRTSFEECVDDLLRYAINIAINCYESD